MVEHVCTLLPHSARGCVPVPVFCCYFLDRKDRVRGTTEIDARSLGEAIARVQEELKRRGDRLAVEIWQGERRVHPEHRDDSIEQSAKRLETLLGGLGGALREPRAHKLRGRPRAAHVKSTSTT